MDTRSSSSRRLGYFDYLKAAFNFRVRVPGLGGVPVNWLYVAGMAGLSLAAWPMALVGAAGELAFLTWMAGSRRFQQVVRAQARVQSGVDVDAVIDHLVETLSENGRARYEVLVRKCREVLEITRKASNIDARALDTYAVNLAELRQVHARMVALAEMFAEHSSDWTETDPLPEIEALEKEMEADGMDDQMRASREGTLEILRKRAAHREEISARARVVHSEIERLEQQVALLRDQALLTGDPSVLSSSMDVAAGMIEDRSEWLQDNAAFVQAMEQFEQN